LLVCEALIWWFWFLQISDLNLNRFSFAYSNFDLRLSINGLQFSNYALTLSNNGLRISNNALSNLEKVNLADKNADMVKAMDTELKAIIKKK